MNAVIIRGVPEQEDSMVVWRAAGTWLLTIAGAAGVIVETVAWQVQPLVYWPSLAVFVAGLVILRHQGWL